MIIIKNYHIYLYPVILFITIITFPGCFDKIGSKNEYKDKTKFKKLATKLYVDFDTSMQSEKYKSKIDSNRPLFNFFRYYYDKNSLDTAIPQEICKVPKILHYIWLGKKLPEQYMQYLNSWFKYQPDWTYVFWVDNSKNYDLGELKNFDLDDLKKYLEASNINNLPEQKKIVIDVKNINFDNKKFFYESRNYGQRSDILKWEALYRFGGVYIDVDFECINPLDILNHTYDFYAGIQPLDTGIIQLGSAIVAACPHHPILKRCVETIKDDWIHQQITVSTGALHFTKAFCEGVNNNNFISIALPANYFYPCGYEEQRLPRKNWLKPESFAIHHWAGSWLKPDGWDQRDA
ncbi:MAG: hypothetical protein UR12_C0013G0009 [candidate division TM6 bacterium GW2011_GWF2_30_66]|jgi:mannosyltransferase OCH1-like enzyme|nr:MAG: hypothetical protein UR12_C0013G0009 [candidate division TM6 bacterium GW2011_GWF2_30_66]